jgi:hypothetical protein
MKFLAVNLSRTTSHWLAKSFNLINIKAGFFQSDVMPKGVFSIFKKDPLLICDLVILITVVYFFILLLLNNFELACCKTWTGPWTGLVNYGLDL